jgi:hypothetical protein
MNYTENDSKTDERKKWKYVNKGEGRENYRRLRNGFKRATDKEKEFHRPGCYDLMYMKTRRLGWKENHGLETLASRTLKGFYP